jgi:EAL and modified HD-GYP domain-containing signal transduction protein
VPHLLARQPIFDHALRVCGYELLFRPGSGLAGQPFDGDQATSSVMVNAFIDRTAEQIVGNVPAFVNMTSALLQNEMLELLPKESVVLEILETVVADDALVAAVQRLRKLGFRFALDDFEWRPELIPLIDLVDYVKIDVLALTDDQVLEQLDHLSGARCVLLAEKVETREMLEKCRAWGFSHFQGYFLSKPHIVPGKSISANQAVVLRLLAQIYDPQVDINTLERLIQMDAAVSYGLLRLINSAFYNLPRKLSSLHEALVILGLRTTRQWLTLISLAGLENKPSELLVSAMVRGKICELLAHHAGLPRAESFFVVGLFSLLDAMLDRPIDEILVGLPLSKDVAHAITGAGRWSGDVEPSSAQEEALCCAVAFEEARLGDVRFRQLTEEQLRDLYVEAVAWARQVLSEIHR